MKIFVKSVGRLVILITAIGLSKLSAADYYVSPSGNDVNLGTSIGSPKATIQALVNDYDLEPGDIIHLAAGTYNEDNINFESDDNGFTIQGAGQGVTIIKGTDSNTGFTFDNDQNDDITFSNLTIEDMGNAIYILRTITGLAFNDVTFNSNDGNQGSVMLITWDDSEITFTDCIISNNTAATGKGVVYTQSENTTITFTDCQMYGNSSQLGGAVFNHSGIGAVNGNYTFDRCKMYNNTVTNGNGAVIHISDATLLELRNCLIYENSVSGDGITLGFGAIYVKDVTTATLHHATFVDNTSSVTHGGIHVPSGSAKVYNSIIYNNSGDDLSGAGTIDLDNSVYGSFSASGIPFGCTTSDPLFTDAANDDYTLTSASPAIQLGTLLNGYLAVDILGNSRENDPDAGVYQFTCSVPDITVSGSLNPFSSCSGTASSSQSFTVSGCGLTANILVTPPAGYEVSTNNSTFFSSVTLTRTGSEVSNTTVYVRLKSNASNGAGGNIAITSTGATTRNVATGSATVSYSTYYVSSIGNDANDGLNSWSAFATIQKAIDEADGCATTTINIGAGTYNEENITIPDGLSDITFAGAGPGSTKFQGDGSGRFVVFENNGDADATDNTSGITFSDMEIEGYGSTDVGGAIKIEENITDITFSNVIFDSNSSTNTTGGKGAGALFIEEGSEVTLSDVTFTGNSAYAGGAVYADGASGNLSVLTIVRTRFNSNSATTGDGGAIYTNYTTLTLTNDLFYENTANSGSGGAINSEYGSTTAYNLTVADNTSDTEGGGMRSNNGNHYYTNSIFYNNVANSDAFENVYQGNGFLSLNYCISSGSTSGAFESNDVGEVDPLFADAAADDYSLTDASPAKDAGTATLAPSDDIEGTTRDDGSIDLGCYEKTSSVWVWTGNISTAWLTPGNWSTGVVPIVSSEVQIPDVINQPDITSVVEIESLTIDAGASIEVSSNSLTVNGTLDCNAEMKIENATVYAKGATDFTGGTVNFTNSNGVLSLDGSITSLGTLDTFMGTVKYNSNDAQTILSDDYYSLHFSGDGTGVKSLPSDITVWGNLTIDANCEKVEIGDNTLTVKGTSDINSELEFNHANSVFNADGLFDATGGTIDFTNNTARLILSSTVLSLGTLDVLNGIVEYDGTTQSVLGDTYYHLEIDRSGSKSAIGTVNVSGNLTVNGLATFNVSSTSTTVTGTTDVNGILKIGSGTLTANGVFDATGATIDFTGFGLLKLGSTVTSLGTLDNSMGTVEYFGGTQNVRGDNYYNLTISTSGTKSALDSIDVDGNLIVSATAGCVFDLQNHDLNLAGLMNVGVENGLDASDADCQVTFDGSGTQFLTHLGVSGVGGSSTELLNYDFSGDEVGWTTENYGNGNEWTVDGSNGWLDYSYDASNAADTWFWTEAIMVTGSNINVSFDAWVRSSSFPENLKVFLCTSQTNSGTELADYSGMTNNTRDTKSLDVSDVTPGTYYIGFQCYSTANQWELRVDDIVVSQVEAVEASEFNDFVINKSGGQIELLSEVQVSGNLDFQDGIIDASLNPLSFATTGTVLGASNSAHVIGTIKKTTNSGATFTFPIGNGSRYEPLGISAASSDETEWSLTYEESAYEPTKLALDLFAVSSDEY